MRLPDPGSGPAEYPEDHEEHLSLRMVWLLLVGWWLSAFWVVAAWVCVVLGITVPAGLRMLGRVHYIVALKAPHPACLDLVDDTIWSLEQNDVPQRPLIARGLYAVLIGWWLSFLWAMLSWSQSLRLQNGSTAVTMFMRLPTILTLRRI